MSQAKPRMSEEASLSSVADTSRNVGGQGQQQRPASIPYPPDVFNNPSPSTGIMPLFEEPTPSSNPQMDQSFFNLPSPASMGDMMSGSGSLFSPSIRFFPGANGTPTGWSPRFNMIGFGGPNALFNPSPTAAFAFGQSPFSMTPTGLMPPPGPSLTSQQSPRPQFKVPYQPNRRDDDTKSGISSEGVSPNSSFIPQLAHNPPYSDTTETMSAMQLSTLIGRTAQSVSPVPSVPQLQQHSVQPTPPQPVKGTGKRGRRPHSQVAAAAARPPAVMDQKALEAPPTQSPSPMSPSTRKRNARRPPPLHLSPRNTELEPVDVPMSSFKLVVGAQKLCKFRRYNVTLTIPKAWRIERGLSESKVMSALLEAKCCRAGTSVIAGCPRCKCQPVVSLFAMSKWPQAGNVSDGNETYSCCIRTRCSSSRDHLKSSLTLVLDGLPLSECIVSNSFVLLARDKTLAPKRARSFEFVQGGVGFNDDEDDEDNGGSKSRSDGSTEELSRKTHRGGTGVTKRRQQRSAAAASKMKSMKTTVDVPVKQARVNFPPIPSFPAQSHSIRQQEGAAVPPSSNIGSVNNSGAATTTERYEEPGIKSEVQYNPESGQMTAVEPNSGGQVPYASGGKTPSPIQPSSASLPSPTPCSTPTGLFGDGLSINAYDGNQMGQMGWSLSPMISAIDQQ